MIKKNRIVSYILKFTNYIMLSQLHFQKHDQSLILLIQIFYLFLLLFRSLLLNFSINIFFFFFPVRLSCSIQGSVPCSTLQ